MYWKKLQQKLTHENHSMTQTIYAKKFYTVIHLFVILKTKKQCTSDNSS